MEVIKKVTRKIPEMMKRSKWTLKEPLSMFWLFVGSFLLLLKGAIKNITLKWQINRKI